MDKSKSIFMDSAFFLAIATAFLYFITYMYKSVYMSFFYIPKSYISISIDVVLNFLEKFKGIWLILVFLIIIYGFVFVEIKKFKEYKNYNLIRESEEISSGWKIKIENYAKIIIFLFAITIGFSVSSIIKGNYFISSIPMIVFIIYILYLFWLKGIEYKIKFIYFLFLFLAFIFTSLPLAKIEFLNIKELPSVNIDNQEYVLINQSRESLILKKYLKDDTIKTIKDRKEFYVKEPKDSYEYSYVEFKKD